MTTNAALVEALVQLVDKYDQLNNLQGPTAKMLVEDIVTTEIGEGVTHYFVDGTYAVLLEQARAMLKRHYGASVLDHELLEILLDEMDDLENCND